jgi:hypothetical protein
MQTREFECGGGWGKLVNAGQFMKSKLVSASRREQGIFVRLDPGHLLIRHRHARFMDGWRLPQQLFRLAALNPAHACDVRHKKGQ